MVNPHVVLMSGSLRAGSTSDRVAAWCADRCGEKGATTRMFRGGELDLPFYRPGISADHEGAVTLLYELSKADAVVLVSPTYHGTLSGLLKNALDFVNDLVDPPFLDGRAIGSVAIGAGTQGVASTLATLRTISHALRGWPTPLGVTLSNAESLFQPTSAGTERIRSQLTEMISQLLTIGELRARMIDASVEAVV